jgi:hypothetical protein
MSAAVGGNTHSTSSYSKGKAVIWQVKRALLWAVWGEHWRPDTHFATATRNAWTPGRSAAPLRSAPATNAKSHSRSREAKIPLVAQPQTQRGGRRTHGDGEPSGQDRSAEGGGNKAEKATPVFHLRGTTPIWPAHLFRAPTPRLLPPSRLFLPSHLLLGPGTGRRGQGQKVVRSCSAQRERERERERERRERESDGGWQGRRAGEPTPSHGIAGSPHPPGAAASRRAAILRRASRAGGLQCSSPLPDARAPLWFVQPHFSRFLFTYYSLFFFLSRKNLASS